MKFSVHVLFTNGREIKVATYDSEEAAVRLADEYELDSNVLDVFVECYAD